MLAALLGDPLVVAIDGTHTFETVSLNTDALSRATDKDAEAISIFPNRASHHDGGIVEIIVGLECGRPEVDNVKAEIGILK